MRAVMDLEDSPNYVLHATPVIGGEGEVEEWRVYHAIYLLFCKLRRALEDA